MSPPLTSLVLVLDKDDLLEYGTCTTRSSMVHVVWRGMGSRIWLSACCLSVCLLVRVE